MSEDVCVQGSTCTNKVLIHHRQHAQVTVYMAFTLCLEYTDVIGKQKQQKNKDEDGFPGVHHSTASSSTCTCGTD